MKNTSSIVKYIFKLYPFALNTKICNFINLVYSIWISINFKHVGLNFRINHSIFLKGGKYITIGNNFFSERGLRIEAYDKHGESIFTPNLVIGDNVVFNYDCHVGCVGNICIGNNVLFASRVFITDHFHGDSTSLIELAIPPNLRKIYYKGSVIIDDNVWVGEGVSIMPDVTIGKGAVIGANSVVTKSIPPYSIAVGNPARVIKTFI